MFSLIVLFLVCLYMVFGYPITDGVPKSLAELSIILGFWGAVIVFFLIIVLVYQDMTSMIEDRNRRSKFSWGKEEEDYVDADYEEGP